MDVDILHHQVIRQRLNDKVKFEKHYKERKTNVRVGSWLGFPRMAGEQQRGNQSHALTARHKIGRSWISPDRPTQRS